MKRLLSVVVVAVVACGGSDGDESSGGSVNSNMSGTWVGPGALLVDPYAPQGYTGHLVVAASGTRVTVAGFCFDGSGSMTIQGSGNTASWTGAYTCPSVAFINCSSVALTFREASLVLNNGVLSASGSGTLTGCGQTKPFTLSLTGTKQ